MQQPFNPSCSSAARLEIHFARAFGLSQSPRHNPPSKSWREKLQKKQGICLLGNYKLRMQPHFITIQLMMASPPRASLCLLHSSTD